MSTTNHRDALKRGALYGVGALVAGGLFYAWLGVEHDADYLTLIGSSQVHAELASQIPTATDKLEALELRQRLLADSRDFLDRAERRSPGEFDTAQMRAYLAFVEGDYATAAAGYRALQDWPELDAATRSRMSVREAKALSNAGLLEDALGVLDTVVALADPDDRIVATGLRVRILDRLGRRDDARTAAVGLAEASGDGSDGVRTAAMLLESLGAYGAAEGAWRRAGRETPVLEYHLARLKLRSGESDNGLRLLQTSIASGHPEVSSLLRQDRELWEAASGRSLESLIDAGVGPAAPAAGR